MHLKQLEAFVAVVDHRSFSKAAGAIYLSQPTISAHIRSLETELDTALLIRSTREVYPSAAGRLFYGRAVELLRMRDRAVMELNSFRTEIKGPLSIAASTVPAQHLLPVVLPDLVGLYPDVLYQVAQADSAEVARLVSEGEAEVGICGSVTERAGCRFEAFMQDRLTVITPNADPYRTLSKLTPEDLAKFPFVIRESGSGTRRESEKFLESIGIGQKDLRVAAELPGTESVKQAVRNGLGISIISKVAAEEYVRFGELLSFDFDSPLLLRSFYFVTHRLRPLSPAGEFFVREAGARCREAAEGKDA